MRERERERERENKQRERTEATMINRQRDSHGVDGRERPDRTRKKKREKNLKRLMVRHGMVVKLHKIT